MKATELLKTQHQEVDAMFEQIEQAEGEQARPLVEQLVSMLLAHSMIEKEIFYPAASEAPEAKKLHEAYEEHALVEIAMHKLLSTEAGDELFHARVSVLKELVQHHVEEEEKEVLAKAEQMMPDQLLEELGMAMEQQFELLKAGDARQMLAEQIEQAMPRTTTRRRSQSTKQAAGRGASRSKSTTQRASKGGRSASGRGTAKRTTGKRTTAKRTTAKRSTGGRSTGAGSTSSASTGGRKQAASKGRSTQKSARGAQGRSAKGRSSGQSGGSKGGRRSSTGSR